MLPFIIFIPWLLAWPGEERNRRSLKKKTKENVKEENEEPKRKREREGTRRRRKVRCVGGLERGGKYYESIFLTDWQSPRRHLFREK